MSKRTHKILTIIGISLFYSILCQLIVYLSLASHYWFQFDSWQMLGLSTLLGIFSGTFLPLYFYQHAPKVRARLKQKKHTNQ